MRRCLWNVGHIDLLIVFLHAIFFARYFLEGGAVGVELSDFFLIHGRRVLVGLGFGFEQIDLPVVFVDFQIIVAAVEKQQPDNKRHEDDECGALSHLGTHFGRRNFL